MAETAPSPVKAYKGFNKRLQCQGLQFEIGGEYTHEGEERQVGTG